MRTGTFNRTINKEGQVVIVTTRVPTELPGGEIAKDPRGHTVYTETSTQLRARVKVMRGGERLVRNNILQVGDAVGLFKLSDIDYLNEQSSLSIPGQGVTFKMDKPIHKKTHLECNLRRSEL